VALVEDSVAFSQLALSLEVPMLQLPLHPRERQRGGGREGWREEEGERERKGGVERDIDREGGKERARAFRGWI